MSKRNIETIEKVKRNYLWYPYVPFSEVSVFQGQAGYGKTTIISRVMAEVSWGIYPPRLIHGRIKDRSKLTEWESYAIDYIMDRDSDDDLGVEHVETVIYNGIKVEGIDDEDLEEIVSQAPELDSPFMRPIGNPLKIVYITRENDYGDIRAKYELFGGKEGSLQIEDESDEKFSTNIDKIRNLVGDAEFVVVDPIFPFIEGSLANNDDVAVMMNNFEIVAKETGSAILLLNNLKKDAVSDHDAGLGASNLKNISRSMFKLDLEKPFLYIEGVKNNLAPWKGKIAVLIDDIGRVGFMNMNRLTRIVGSLGSDKKAKQAIKDLQADRPTPKQDKAIEFLLDLLKDRPVPSDTVFETARKAGISSTTLNRAKAVVGVKSVRVDGNKTVWAWNEK